MGRLSLGLLQKCLVWKLTDIMNICDTCSFQYKKSHVVNVSALNEISLFTVSAYIQFFLTLFWLFRLAYHLHDYDCCGAQNVYFSLNRFAVLRLHAHGFVTFDLQCCEGDDLAQVDNVSNHGSHFHNRCCCLWGVMPSCYDTNVFRELSI